MQKSLIWIMILLMILSMAGCGSPDTENAAEESDEDESESFTEDTSETASDESSESGQEMNESLSEEEPDPEISSYTVTISGGQRYKEILENIISASEEAGAGITTADLEAEADSLISLLPEEASDCCYPLEGYLLAGTYTIQENEDPLTVILNDSLAVIESMITDVDMSIHELITRASIVEIEASCGGDSEAHPEVMPEIAAVIENRLSSGTPLQMNVTMWYADYLTDDCGFDEETASAYDTYQIDALPAGPIGSPSEDALSAVLNPEASDALFFVYDEDGNYYFAETYDEHLENCELIGLY